MENACNDNERIQEYTFVDLFIVALVCMMLSGLYYYYDRQLSWHFANFQLKPVAIYIAKNDDYRDLYIEFTSTIDLNNPNKISSSVDCIVDDNQDRVD